MSELAITLLRLGYLVLLWVFVLSAIGVLRRDLYGTRIVPRRRGARGGDATRAGAPAGDTRRDAAPSRLVVTEGPLTGTTLPLTSSAILIGRAPSCTLVLDDDYSSSRHARLYPEGGQWFVEDLGSTNGTFLGQARVDRPTPVAPGASVRVGKSVLELQR
ncbi:FHA domain-containing protein [uncultured Cellulomonas sp.]|uniref:FHA domain-containing protein FhaB/FipA n=1 Tax=uncultured Cellulomonas sp. TaxID=189682 RepID=UPI002612E4A1|nr:FHA domain-containing protein [uncultured Cellulomonas sp.]